TKKTTTKPAVIDEPLAQSGPRRLKSSHKRFHFRRDKFTKPPVRLPGVWKLTKASLNLLWQNKKLFFGITLIYGLLSLLLVQGLTGGSQISSLKTTINQALKGHTGNLASGLGAFGLLVSSAGSGTSTDSGPYEFFLILMVSLAVIWGLRQVIGGVKVQIRDAYYRGMYPMIPFILVLLTIGLQLLPLLVGTLLYGVVVSGGIAVYAVEKVFWAVLWIGFAIWSLYLVTSSVFALYIVTLPDMTPMKALRSARPLVRYRRLMVLRKLLWLPLALFAVAAVIMAPIIVWLTPLAQWVFFLLTMLAVAIIHSYLYNLYRELLVE
ncbi:MAG TPA: hypothetical protein VG992_01450, partial [Candidatus Saccharimonadales bacterium]|nr:hypothetical protein [Candidatus Saccharimonadales bacterium]